MDIRNDPGKKLFNFYMIEIQGWKHSGPTDGARGILPVIGTKPSIRF
jgi:hypothetical protein